MSLLDDTVGDVSEPHIRQYLSEMLEQARAHYDTMPSLYAAFSREPSAAGSALGKATGVVRELAGHAQGLLGSARGSAWRKLRQLLVTNQDAIGAYAVAEQLGLAMGLRDVVDITFPLIRAKTTDQLLLQEYLLEMAPKAILYHGDL